MSSATPFGFRIEGGCSSDRKLVEYDRAFMAYASCDPLANIELEGFLSPFQYDDEIRHRCQDASQRLEVSAFDGRCWSAFVWFDIDRMNDFKTATSDARRLAAFLQKRYDLDDDQLLVFFSGAKGYHVGLPTSLFDPAPDKQHNLSCRMFAEELAKTIAVEIDTSIYSKVQPLRAPNSRHGKTKLHKRFVSFDELLGLKPETIVTMAEKPCRFDLPPYPPLHDLACRDWESAYGQASQRSTAKAIWDSSRTDLNQLTIDFIRDGAEEGERHTRLFSAAANLGEFNFDERQASVVLNPSALDSGLSPAEIRKTIRDAISKKGGAK